MKTLYKVDGEPIVNKERLNPCFMGAWYHKVFSTTFNWQGITGVLTLPHVKIRRYKDSFDESKDVDYNQKNLDVSSIYIGGFAKNESDVGLAFFRGLILKDGTYVVSEGSLVYRPFWRYITDEDGDIGPYDYEHGRNYSVSMLSNNNGVKNCYAQYSPNFTEYYYLPGDKLRMSIFSPKPNYMQMKIEVLEVSAISSSVELRKANQWREPKDFISPVFSSPGHGTNIPKEYKRVNAIDQVSNEGKPSIDTQTKISSAIWHDCYLYYAENNETYLVPLNEERSYMMNCPNPNRFTYESIDKKTGGSIVTLHPGEEK